MRCLLALPRQLIRVVAVLGLSAAAQGGALAPPAVKPSDLTLRADLVGVMPNGLGSGATNATSPVAWGNDLLLPDQNGYLYRWDGAAAHTLLTPAGAPAGLSLVGREQLVNVAPDLAAGKLYVVYTSSTAPAGVPQNASPRSGSPLWRPAWQVVYAYDYNGAALSNPRAITSFEVNLDGHTGGGLTVLGDGSLLMAHGDNAWYFEEGLGYPQDGASHLGKVVRIDPATGSWQIAAQGVRNVQRLVQVERGGVGRVEFVDIGRTVAEEINSVVSSTLTDATAVENFGWGRNADGKNREGTFYIDTSGNPVGEVAVPEAGFLSPVAQWGREGATSISGTGPVSLSPSFVRIDSLFGDLVSGDLYATTGGVDGPPRDVYRVNLLDANGQATSLYDLAGGRPDPRFFTFGDGTAGVLLERTGAFYRLTEVVPEPSSLMLTGLGLVGLGVWRVRSRKS